MADTRPPDSTLIDFVYREARLLDEKRFEEWWDLFADDARYWMPLTRGQPIGETHTSLFFEDKLLLKVRIERLQHSNAFSQQEPSFCLHVLQRPTVEEADAADDCFLTRTPFFYAESQLDTQIVLAGVVHHQLKSIGGVLKIQLKKIALLNCNAALPSIQLLL